MGIKNFQQFTKRVYKDAYRKVWLKSYDNIYFDLNFILHHVAYVSSNRDDIVSRLKDYIVNVLKITFPKKKIVLTADGVAPMAKLILQRKRRLAMIKGSGSEGIDSTSNTSLNFTAGSDFMMNLTDALDDLKVFLEIAYNVDVVVDVISVDEAEIKTKAYLLDTQKNAPSDTHLVISGDSDVILLLVSCPDIHKIYMMLSKDSTISIGRMMDIHVKTYGFTDRYKEDFTFINLLLGNDYIPKINYVKIETLWEAYSKICLAYPDGILIHHRNNNSTTEDKVTIDPLFFHDLMYYATKKVPKHLMNKFNFFEELDEPIYNNYITGLIWCFGMYNTGSCHCYQYTYNHDEPPHPTGVVFNMMLNNVHYLKKTKPIDIDVYALLLIPEKGVHICQQDKIQIYKKVAVKYPILYDEERCDECKEYYTASSTLNKQYKELSGKQNTESDDVDFSDAINDNVNDDIDDDNVDGEKEEINKKKKEINKQKAIILRKIEKHKFIHKPMTFNEIQKIQKYYIELRDA